MSPSCHSRVVLPTLRTLTWRRRGVGPPRNSQETAEPYNLRASKTRPTHAGHITRCTTLDYWRNDPMRYSLLGSWRGLLVLTSMAICTLSACHAAVERGERASRDTLKQDITPPVVLEVSAERAQEPLTIAAVLTVTAREPVSDMVLSVSTPEGVRAEPSRVPLKLEIGKAQQVRVRLTAPRAGQYRIQFDVKGNAPGYISAGTREVRFLVTDGREARLLTGREVRREMRTRIADSLGKEAALGVEGEASLSKALAGRLRVLPPGTQLPRGDSTQSLAPPSTAIPAYDRVIDRRSTVVPPNDPITVKGRFFYRNENGALRPFVNATIYVYDDDWGPDELVATTITDWDGRYSVTVNNDDGWFQNGRDIYVHVETTNSRFRVQDCSYWPDWTYNWTTGTRSEVSDGSVIDFGDLEPSSYLEAPMIFGYLNRGWNFLTTAGAHDPGFADSCFPEGSTAYDTFWEEINIETGDETDPDVVAHEYGHATMHNAYGGYWPPNTGGNHGFQDILHVNFAFSEGWATFIAMAINNDNTYNDDNMAVSIESFSHSSNHTAGDGPKNEGHVAAGVHDVRDVASDGTCTGSCDPSGANAVPMSKIWRDAFWNSDADNLEDYWRRLCPELTTGERTASMKALAFNESNFKTCVCAIQFALAAAPGTDRDVEAIRQFRDRGLRNTKIGEQLIRLYYRHSDEAVELMNRDPALRQIALQLSRRIALVNVSLLDPRGNAVLLDKEHAAIARNFVARMQQAGSPELRSDFERLKPLIDRVEGMRAGEVRAKFLEKKG